MPVPKRKTSRARRDSRSADKAIKPKAICLCSNCSAPLCPHQACLDCGFYKGSKVLRTKNERLAKRDEIKQAKENRNKQKTQDSELEAQAEQIPEDQDKKK